MEHGEQLKNRQLVHDEEQQELLDDVQLEQQSSDQRGELEPKVQRDVRGQVEHGVQVHVLHGPNGVEQQQLVHGKLVQRGSMEHGLLGELQQRRPVF